MPTIDGPTYGVNLVADHGRWSNIFQEIRGKVTLEICAYGICRNRIFEISAANIIDWAARIAALMASEAAVAKVPLGAGAGPPPEGYTPTFEGPMPITIEVADQSDLGNPPAEYEYFEVGS